MKTIIILLLCAGLVMADCGNPPPKTVFPIDGIITFKNFGFPYPIAGRCGGVFLAKFFVHFNDTKYIVYVMNKETTCYDYAGNVIDCRKVNVGERIYVLFETRTDKGKQTKGCAIEIRELL